MTYSHALFIIILNTREKDNDMRYNEFTNKGLFESPQIVNSTEFNLDNEESNSTFALKLLKKIKEVIIDEPKYQVVKTGDDRNGYIALITKDDKPLINYIIKFQTSNIKGIGHAVTQVILWRKLGGTGTSNITKKIFFDYLLTKYPAIMSDGQQTERGKEFWIGRMVDAITINLKVGLLDKNTKNLTWYDNSKYKDINDWLKDYNGWGEKGFHQSLRYIISN